MEGADQTGKSSRACRKLVGRGGKNGTQGLDEALAEMAKRLSVFLSFAI